MQGLLHNQQGRMLTPQDHDHEADHSVTAEPPTEFLCPISGSLMGDPVTVPSGQVFERACIQACAALSFTPPSSGLDLSRGRYSPASPLPLIPNVPLKNAILNWCARLGFPPPPPLSPDTARDIVRRLMLSLSHPPPSAPPHTADDQYAASSSSSSSSYQHHSRSTSSFSSSSYDHHAPPQKVVPHPQPQLPATTSPIRSDSFDDNCLNGLPDADPSEQESVMMALRQATRENPARRKSLCTPRLLAALRPMLLSDKPVIQINAAAAMVNLSLETDNKVRIVRSGAVSPLVEVLKGGHPEARDHAAGAIYSLALEDENRAAIGVLGAIPPLLYLFADGSADYRARREAGMALYYVSLGDMNRNKIARASGAVRSILALAGIRDGAAPAEAAAIRKLALMVLANLAGCTDGRAVLMDSGAVAVVAGLMNEGVVGLGSAEEEYCLSALYGLSRGSLRFRGLARVAGVEAVLMRVAEEGGEGTMRREMAKRTLRAMRGEDDEAAAAAAAAGLVFGGNYDDGNVVSEGMMSFRRRPKDYGSNTTKF
ncbi:U-box domain-containing protein 41 [Rhynchospora pubera]|uniref:RING-type E3 ubiquitin transferase n=1 Tax=Rhynchospora pubera TaxID=906938 RepID=A0AAV8D0J4_9POAL|nr:U-box domain-containing protein 41 [Rhynchospora pubera]